MNKILPVIIALAMSGCATMKITPNPGQPVTYIDGAAYVVSGKNNCGISIAGIGAATQKPDRAVFRVVFYNMSKRPINFGPENMTATDESGKLLKIFPRDKLIQEAKTAAMWRAVAIGMSAGAQIAAANQPSYSTYSGNYSGTSNYDIYNRNSRYLGNASGYHSGSLYGSSTTYNPAQAAIANQAILANSSSMAQGSQAALSDDMAIASMCLARNTVYPKETVSGLLIVKKAKAINISSSAAGDTHAASFAVK